MKLLHNQVKAYKRVSGGIVNALENSARRDIIKALILTCGLMITDIPMVMGEGELVGTPRRISDATVYEANVEPGQTYTSVFGVCDANTDSKSYGKVTINEGIVTDTVYGNLATSGKNLTKASCNVVKIDKSNIKNVYGGYVRGGVNNANVQSNTLEISGGNVSGYVYGGYAEGKATDVTGNNVIIRYANISRSVYGGDAYNISDWISMFSNSVTIEGGSVNGYVYGGYASGINPAVNSSTVTIKGEAFIKGSIYGGLTSTDNNHSSSANNNVVIIESGTVNGRVCGGMGNSAKNNTIILKGGNLANSDLYGYSDGSKSHEGNTLEVWAANIPIKSAQNFENIYFVAPRGIINQSDKYMLNSSLPVYLSGTNVGIAVENGAVLNIGDTINLINKTEGSATLVPLVGKTLKGGTLFTNYDFTLTNKTSGDKPLVATTLSGPYIPLPPSPGSGGFPKPAGWADEKAKALAEGQAASVALLGEGNELAAGAALEDAKAAAHSASAEGSNMATFATLGYGRSLYDTGSHANIHATDFIVGLSKEYSNSNGELTLGAFFENGRGNYSTHNDFETGSVDGSGKASYYGGGLMFQLDSSKNKGLYVQAIGRIGRMKNKWNSGDFSEYVDYDTRHRYYGADFGLGYERKASENRNYKLYGKFMWTRQKGDNADIQGEHLSFDDINSAKARIGLRMDYKGYRTVKPFWGVAWEREFKGEAKAKVNVYDIKAPSLKGNTGLFEFGLKYKPISKSDWDLNFAVTGYVGARRGVDGQASFNFNF